MSEKVDFTKVSEHSGPETSPGFLLWRVSTRWRRAIEEVLKSVDLTHPQFVVLATIGWLTREGDNVTQVEIGRQACLDPNTTSQILRGLEDKKLIKRKRSEDDRSKHATLTAQGARRLEKALPLVEKADAEFFSPIKVQAGLLSALQKLA